MVRGRAIAVTAVAPKYQWAETTSTARGRGSCRPIARHAAVKPFRSSVFIGLPWPMNKAGMGSVIVRLQLWGPRRSPSHARRLSLPRPFGAIDHAVAVAVEARP